MTKFQGTITRHAGADVAYDMTFGSPTRILMTITPQGELQNAAKQEADALAQKAEAIGKQL